MYSRLNTRFQNTEHVGINLTEQLQFELCDSPHHRFQIVKGNTKNGIFLTSFCLMAFDKIAKLMYHITRIGPEFDWL